jgi:CheY-like chemotaxis protein
MGNNATILIVDDEPFNLDIISEYLTDSGYLVIQATNGQEALAILEKNAAISVVVLDRMMPIMDGMSALRAMRTDPRWLHIPVIMQTAAANHAQIVEGIDAGVYYYLTKPYEENLLLSVVRAAYEEYQQRQEMRELLLATSRAVGFLQNARFQFKKIEDAKAMASLLAHAFPNPEEAMYGLHELLVNAVEHGNLGITYQEKTSLLLSGCWLEEIERRSVLVPYCDRVVKVDIKRDAQQLTVMIEDEGSGFNWQNYLEISPERATHPHGRGIATARLMSFSNLRYLGSGNCVECVAMLNSTD